MKTVCSLLITAMLAAGSASAETVISGAIGTETWTQAAQPYRIQGAVTLTAGNTLTIEPGVNVIFEADARFIVQGTISAVGTAVDSITFAPDYVNTQEWGGLRMSGGVTSTFAYVRIEGGHAEGSSPDDLGGAIYAVDAGTHIEMQNSVLRNNIAYYAGGAMYLAAGATASLTNCQVSWNSTTVNHAGAIAVFDGEVTLVNTTLDRNHADVAGGALYLMRSTATLSSCVLDSNTSLSHGGAIASYEASTLDISNTTITRNIANDRGGAIHATGYGTIDIASSSFTNNTGKSYYGGGTIYIDYMDLTITDSQFTGNTSTGSYGHGGVVRAYQCTIRADNSVFNDNSALGSGAVGGAFFTERTDLVVRNSSVMNNFAYDNGGGFALWNYGSAILDNVDIIGNTASTIDGGGIRVYNRVVVTILNSVITQNTSGGSAGGIGVTDYADVRLIDVRVDSNDAVVNGGGVAVWSNGDIRLTNCSVDSNTTGADGGGVYVESAKLEMLNSTITRNTATDGGAIRAKSTTNVKLTNVTIAQNTATSSGGAVRAFDSTLEFVNTILWNDSPTEVYTDNSSVVALYSLGDLSDPGVVDSLGNIQSDPLFTDPANLNFLPGPGSPAIDAGDPNAVLDKDGTRTDIGRLPYRIAEIEGTLTQTLWTSADSPYRVIGTATVPAGSTLVIEPGTDVFFADGTQLVVNGALQANGTPSDSIRFMPWFSGTWGTIRLMGADSSSISFARITGSRASGAGTLDQGGAIYVEAGARLGLDNVVIADTYADYFGGAIFVGANSVLTAASTNFLHTVGLRGGAISAIESALLSVENSNFIADSAYGYSGYGGAISAETVADVNLISCTFDTNVTTGSYGYGGAVFINGQGTTLIEDCSFTHNEAYYDNGGAIWAGGGAVVDVVRTEITHNRADRGAILMTGYGTRVNLRNSVLSDNFADYTAGGIHIADYAELSSENSILWNNAPYEIYNHLSWPVNVKLSHTLANVDATWLNLGPGNMNADPMFTDPAAGDYSLTALSPAIDTGDPDMPLDPDGTRLDLGPYPFNQSALRLELPTAIYPTYSISAGDTVRVPIRAWLSDAYSVQFGLIVDTGALVPADSASFIENNALTGLNLLDGTHEQSGDTVRVAYSAADPLTIADNVLMDLVYIATQDLYPGQEVALTWLDYPETNIDEGAVVTANGAVIIEPIPQDVFYGDVSGDSAISAYDAALVLQFVVHAIDTIDEYAANVSGNDYVSAYDAALVLYKVVTPSYIFPVLGGPLLKPASAPRTLAWESSENGWRLNIDDASALVSGRIVVELAPGSDVTASGPGTFFSHTEDGRLTVAFARLPSDNTELFTLTGADPLIAPAVADYELNEGAIAVTDIERPVQFALQQNAPNPFNPSTTIRFTVPEAGLVNLAIYDVNGRFVSAVVDAELPVGHHEIVWNGTDTAGRAVASGVYVYRLRTAGGALTRRMTLVR